MAWRAARITPVLLPPATRTFIGPRAFSSHHLLGGPRRRDRRRVGRKQHTAHGATVGEGVDDDLTAVQLDHAARQGEAEDEAARPGDRGRPDERAAASFDLARALPSSALAGVTHAVHLAVDVGGCKFAARQGELWTDIPLGALGYDFTFRAFTCVAGEDTTRQLAWYLRRTQP